MKKLSRLVPFIMLACMSAFGVEKTWTGQISDSMCGASHKSMLKDHKKAGEVSKQEAKKDEARECTLACIKSGGKYVFVSQGKVYEIENQDHAGLQQHAGHTVKLAGELNANGKSIKVSNITMPGDAGKKDEKKSY